MGIEFVWKFVDMGFLEIKVPLETESVYQIARPAIMPKMTRPEGVFFVAMLPHTAIVSQIEYVCFLMNAQVAM
jgi:hypothetical protein